jgi:hypothetical protein
MVMARDQNAGHSHNMKIDNSSIERVEEFKYLGTTLTNQRVTLCTALDTHYSLKHMLPQQCKSFNDVFY